MAGRRKSEDLVKVTEHVTSKTGKVDKKGAVIARDTHTSEQ